MQDSLCGQARETLSGVRDEADQDGFAVFEGVLAKALTEEREGSRGRTVATLLEAISVLETDADNTDFALDEQDRAAKLAEQKSHSL